MYEYSYILYVTYVTGDARPVLRGARQAGARGDRAPHARAVRLRERARRAPDPRRAGPQPREPRQPRGPLRLVRARRDLQVRTARRRRRRFTCCFLPCHSPLLVYCTGVLIRVYSSVTSYSHYLYDYYVRVLPGTSTCSLPKGKRNTLSC